MFKLSNCKVLKTAVACIPMTLVMLACLGHHWVGISYVHFFFPHVGLTLENTSYSHFCSKVIHLQNFWVLHWMVFLPPHKLVWVLCSYWWLDCVVSSGITFHKNWSAVVSNMQICNW